MTTFECICFHGDPFIRIGVAGFLSTSVFFPEDKVATSRSGGRSRSTQRKPPTMGKQLVSLITCGCESSALFCNLQSRERTHAVLVLGLYELLGNPTT
jgi:hypothetical protein